MLRVSVSSSSLLDVDVVGIHGGEEGFKIAYEIERHHMLFMNGFKLQMWVVHGIYYLLGGVS